jgi:hypothetical protein
MQRGVLFTVALLVGFLFACHGKVAPEDCTRMLDRYIDMVLATDKATKDLPPAQASAVREMKKAVKKAEPTYAKAERQCHAEVSRSEYDCAMSAKNPDEWEACIE